MPSCIYCLNCIKFGSLILRKIIKFVATRCQILRLKCTKFNLGWGSTQDPAGGAYSAPPDPLAGFKGLSCKDREGRKRSSGVARNLIWGGVYVLTSHCNFKTCVNVPHMNKTVTDFWGIYIPIYPPSLRPWRGGKGGGKKRKKGEVGGKGRGEKGCSPPNIQTKLCPWVNLAILTIWYLFNTPHSTRSSSVDTLSCPPTKCQLLF